MNTPATRNRFNRRGGVVREMRTFVESFDTHDYKPQPKSKPIDATRIFAPRTSSPARKDWQYAHNRRATTLAATRAMQAVHKAAAK